MIAQTLLEIIPLHGNKIRNLLICSCIVIFLLLAHVRLSCYAEDDAYIHFRIAQNFIEQGVPFYNLNDQIHASSSVTWLILVSFMFRIFSPSPIIIAYLNVIITLLGAIVWKALLQKCTKEEKPEIVYWVFVILYLALVISTSISLMETSLFLLLFGVGLFLLLDNKPASFLFFGVMIFTRFESIVFLLVLLIYSSVRKLMVIRDMLLYLFLGLLPFSLFSIYYWGALIPHTLTAKQEVYTLSSLQTVFNVINSLFHNVGKIQIGIGFWIGYSLAFFLLLAYILISIELHKKQNDKDRMVAYILIFCGFAIIGAYIFKQILIFPWYVPIYSIPIMFGVYSTMIQSSKPYRWFLILLLLPWTLSVLTSFTQIIVSVSTNDPTTYPFIKQGARVRKYLEVGKILYRHYPQATLMTSEIGGLGFNFDGYIYDGAGLISPGALKYHPMPVPDERSSGVLGAIPVRFIDEIFPDIIVSYDIFCEAFLRSELIDQYIIIREPVFIDEDLTTIPSHEIWGSQNLYIFIKKEIFVDVYQ